jgi:asparagine synthase (glutamine-hydrolysing)
MRLRDLSQEVVELGPRGALFRASWELCTRARAAAGRPPRSPSHPEETKESATVPWTTRLPLADPVSVASALGGRVAPNALRRLQNAADGALAGRILCFDRWYADYGQPIDWSLNPVTGERWPSGVIAARAMRDQGRVGDVKLTWEIGRFPHAYYLARAAAFIPERAAEYATGLTEQIVDFARANPEGCGVHWASGQEIALRLVAWLFALDTLLVRGPTAAEASRAIATALATGARHIEANLAYARVAVRNNHVLSEALGLLAAGTFLSGSRAAGWRDTGLSILAEEADRQFYDDGAYINQGHNYHRSALLMLLWASAFARAAGRRLPDACTRAMERSLIFLLAHQNATDGRLPNYGANDGSLPGILSTCDFSDFRPLLQTLSVVLRGERLYQPGPWDEMPLWLVGPGVLDLPIRPPTRTSVSFALTGYHLLRGADESSFCTFRCGSLRDRFSQIDMLHLDVWWRGLNVLTDGGSYLYNGPDVWHEHFMRTGSHNTIELDGRDQMLHFRRFKTLYWTRASLRRFEDHQGWALVDGEHYGYRRHPGGCVHRRAVLMLKDDMWVVVDRIDGDGDHDVRLQWLCGAFPFIADEANGGIGLQTPKGIFTVRVFDEQARGVRATVVAGSEQPPRGWLSIHYGDKVVVPSLVVEQRLRAPVTFVSVLSGTEYGITTAAGKWHIVSADMATTFTVGDQLVGSVERRSTETTHV